MTRVQTSSLKGLKLVNQSVIIFIMKQGSYLWRSYNNAYERTWNGLCSARNFTQVLCYCSVSEYSFYRNLRQRLLIFLFFLKKKHTNEETWRWLTLVFFFLKNNPNISNWFIIIECKKRDCTLLQKTPQKRDFGIKLAWRIFYTF